jgi:hypothetical protein
MTITPSGRREREVWYEGEMSVDGNRRGCDPVNHLPGYGAGSAEGRREGVWRNRGDGEEDGKTDGAQQEWRNCYTAYLSLGSREPTGTLLLGRPLKDGGTIKGVELASGWRGVLVWERKSPHVSHADWCAMHDFEKDTTVTVLKDKSDIK